MVGLSNDHNNKNAEGGGEVLVVTSSHPNHGQSQFPFAPISSHPFFFFFFSLPGGGGVFRFMSDESDREKKVKIFAGMGPSLESLQAEFHVPEKFSCSIYAIPGTSVWIRQSE